MPLRMREHTADGNARVCVGITQFAVTWLVTALAAATVASCRASLPADPAGAVISTRDVHNFVRAYSTLDPGDPECHGLEAYFEQRTDGLKPFRRIVGDHESVCRALRRRPEAYARIDAQLDQIDSLAIEVRHLFDALSDFYPDAVFPDVTFGVGRFMAAGSHRRGRVYVGVEQASSLDRVPCLVAHELVHAQQRHPWWRVRLTGGPRFLRPFQGTVLVHSVREGAADFVRELFTDCAVETPAYVEGREAEVWEAFRRDMLGRDISMWIYNGWNRERLGERPPDLGYYMGYRIARAYHERAPDKEAAVRDILTIRDFRRFFDESGCAHGC